MRKFDHWIISGFIILICAVFCVYIYAESEIRVAKELAYDALETAAKMHFRLMDANDRIKKLEETLYLTNQIDIKYSYNFKDSVSF
ncbi:hypothetical protein M0R01_04890 [bacterium]|jgi:hypothetical protein|nr:hypothetical protein [bacterium]